MQGDLTELKNNLTVMHSLTAGRLSEMEKIAAKQKTFDKVKMSELEKLVQNEKYAQNARLARISEEVEVQQRILTVTDRLIKAINGTAGDAHFTGYNMLTKPSEGDK